MAVGDESTGLLKSLKEPAPQGRLFLLLLRYLMIVLPAYN